MHFPIANVNRKAGSKYFTLCLVLLKTLTYVDLDNQQFCKTFILWKNKWPKRKKKEKYARPEIFMT